MSTYDGHVPDGRPDQIEISDEELTELALAADPDLPIPADAVPFSERAPQVTK